MRTLSLLIGLLSANFLLAQKASPPPTAQQILDRYVKVTGGKIAYDKVKTVTMLGIMEIKGQNVSGEMKMYRVDGGKYYTVVDLPGVGKQEDGSDGITVWDKTVLGPRLKTGEEKFLAACATSAMSEYQRSATELSKCYSKFEYSGEETIAGKVYQKLTLTPKLGKPELQYYDKLTGLLSRTKLILPSPMGDVPILVVIEEYKTVEGVITPVKLTNQMGPMEMGVTFSTVKFNDKLPDSLFVLPADIQALVEAEKKTTP